MPVLTYVDAAVPPPPAYPLPCVQTFPTRRDHRFPMPLRRPVTRGPPTSPPLYKIHGWGTPYFAINAAGNISVRPFGASTLPHQGIDLINVVKKASDTKTSGGRGLQLPLIVRFPDVLRHRFESLSSAFELAIQSSGYRSRYQGVYPVKCNQDRFIVQDIVEFGFPFQFGLEAGLKPELLLAMSWLINGSSDAFLVCNGYKDEEYISLALLGRS